MMISLIDTTNKSTSAKQNLIRQGGHTLPGKAIKRQTSKRQALGIVLVDQWIDQDYADKRRVVAVEHSLDGRRDQAAAVGRPEQTVDHDTLAVSYTHLTLPTSDLV